jgi:lactate dehydrogenase-like 2-hydroxyacid dehydrogenase
MKIIIINSRKDFSKNQVDALRKAGKLIFVEKEPNYKDPLFADAEEKIVAVGPELVNWKFPNTVISSIPNIKAICLPTTSFGWIDGGHARKNGIKLTNVPKYSTPDY